MYVRDFMSSPPITVQQSMRFSDALKLMHERKIRRLPIVDKAGRLLGIVTERDLFLASPSPATSLTVWELNFLLERMTVADVMSKKQMVVAHPDMAIQEAARLMMQNRIGGLPVVDEHNMVVGVITETDIFRVLIDWADAAEKTTASVIEPA